MAIPVLGSTDHLSTKAVDIARMVNELPGREQHLVYRMVEALLEWRVRTQTPESEQRSGSTDEIRRRPEYLAAMKRFRDSLGGRE